MDDTVSRETLASHIPAIPVRLNIAIAAGAIAAAVGCLWLAGHAAHWWVIAAAAFAFSFVNNTIFSLLHECVHGTFHPRRRINDAGVSIVRGGWLASANYVGYFAGALSVIWWRIGATTGVRLGLAFRRADRLVAAHPRCVRGQEPHDRRAIDVGKPEPDLEERRAREPAIDLVDQLRPGLGGAHARMVGIR